ncbi:MAG TPA: hypothetical protein PK530_23110, partial [Anaerolineales bacterium]|nr:hypothetical protein [Anaerolineales bacterium]
MRPLLQGLKRRWIAVLLTALLTIALTACTPSPTSTAPPNTPTPSAENTPTVLPTPTEALPTPTGEPVTGLGVGRTIGVFSAEGV